MGASAVVELARPIEDTDVMQNRIKSRALIVLICAVIGAPAFAAGPEGRPGDYAMVADLVVARPLGVVFTAVGAAVFVVSLPFTAPSGGIKQAAQGLVVGPAKETFVRCLGCQSSGYQHSSPAAGQ
jgi:hypothetical protein